MRVLTRRHTLRLCQSAISSSATVRRIVEVTEESGESVQFFSGQRVVLIKSLPIKDLEPGKYTVAVDVKDLINDQTVAAQDNFQVTFPSQVASR
jgi:hypothetical protein